MAGKPTGTDDLRSREITNSRQISGKSAWDQTRLFDCGQQLYSLVGLRGERGKVWSGELWKKCYV